MSENTTLAIGSLMVVAWLSFVWGGTAYLVEVRDWSPWWFVLSFFLTCNSSVKVNT
jgi:hypothetical protein